jgi:hypothetical protein
MRTPSKTIALMSAVAAAVALAACAAGPVSNTATLTYETSPEGAALFEAGQPIGVAPVTRTYTATGTGDIRTPEVTAVWPSGAKESYYTFLAVGADRNATIERPAKAAGLPVDQENAKKFVTAKQAAAQKQREEAARELARGSARCKEQTARGGAKAGVDDCN